MNPNPGWVDYLSSALFAASIPLILGILALGTYAWLRWKDRNR